MRCRNFDVRVVDLEDIKITKQLKGHVGSVRRVTWHPSSPILVYSTLINEYMILIIEATDYFGCRWKDNRMEYVS